MNVKSLRFDVNRFTGSFSTLFQNRNFMIGFTITISIVLSGVTPVFLSIPYPHFGDYETRLPMGSPGHPLGTDPLGRDLFSTLLWSVGSSLVIGFTAATTGTFIAIVIGFFAAHKGGILDDVLRSFTDIFMVIPVWPILVLLSVLIRNFDMVTLALVLAAFSWPSAARSIRSQVLTLKEREFVNVARLSGLTSSEILFKDILPNMIPYVISGFVTSVTAAMLAEVSLEIIGLGPQNLTSLGLMIFWALNFNSMIKGWWWLIVPPVLILIVLFAGLFLMSLGFDEISNPRIGRK